MSHFSVLVAANDDNDLEAKLQPFHEYECTGVKDQYVVFEEANLEECVAEFQEKRDEYECYKTFEEYMQDYHGYEQLRYDSDCNDDGGVKIKLDTYRWGRWTNPNRKWDWWVIGGRWADTLLLKNGCYVDFGANSNIDWNGMKQKRYDIAVENHNIWHEAKVMFDSESDRRRFLIDKGLYLLSGSEEKALDELTLEDYATSKSQEPLFFAWIDQKGEWHEKATMGWFGMTHDENKDATDEFWSFVDSLPPNQWLFVVDCHI